MQASKEMCGDLAHTWSEDDDHLCANGIRNEQRIDDGASDKQNQTLRSIHNFSTLKTISGLT